MQANSYTLTSKASTADLTTKIRRGTTGITTTIRPVHILALHDSKQVEITLCQNTAAKISRTYCGSSTDFYVFVAMARVYRPTKSRNVADEEGH